MRKQLAFAGILALLMGTGAIISNPLHAQQQVLDPQTGQQPIEPGEATGLLTTVEEVGGFIEVDGILYQVGEGIDLGDLSPGQQVTVRYEPSDMPGTPLATEIMEGEG
jgi:hypothetical protein